MQRQLGYAQALFSIALENKKLDNFKSNALGLLEILKENPETFKLFSTKNISKEEKKEILTSVFGAEIEPLLLTGLKLMIDHNKFYSLEKTLSELNSLINKELNLEEGLVYSAKSLEKDDIAKITEKLEKKFKNKIELKNIIDPTLIDGVKVILNNQVIDNTLSSKLKTLEQEIIEGK